MNGLGWDRYTAKNLVVISRSGGNIGSGTWIGWTTWNMMWFVSFLFDELQVRLYPKKQAVYLMMGGNQTSHSHDLFGNYNLNWVGTSGHDSTGFTPAQSPFSYGYMPISMVTLLNSNKNWNFSVYIATNVANDGGNDVGGGSGSSLALLNTRNVSNNAVYYGNSSAATNYVLANSTNSIGFWNCFTSDGWWAFYKNGIGQNGINTNTYTPNAVAFHVGAAGGHGASVRKIQFAHIGLSHNKHGVAATGGMSSWVGWFQATVLGR